jgi:hypothetical protein
MALFRVVPKTAEETYVDTSGNPIVGRGAPRMVIGRYGCCWSSLEKATHWLSIPALPLSDTTQDRGGAA